MRTWQRRWKGQAVLGAALVAGLMGCKPQNQLLEPPPPQVTVAHPVERELQDSLEFSGWTEATASVELRSRVSGYLEKVLFEDGATVNEGDVLFLIEQAPFQNALDMATAEQQKAEAALALAQTEYNRAVPLVRRAAITQAELDVKAAELATAKANVSAAKAGVRKAQRDLSYTELRAPITGRIGRRLVDPGNLVALGETMLARIESIDPIYAYFSVSESDLLEFLKVARENGETLAELEKNPPALQLGLANEEGYPREGKFDFSERRVDRETGTAMRRGVFANADQTLIPGLFVRIRAPVGPPRPRLMVEERAVGADQRGDFLLVVNDQKTVEYRPVKLGAANEGLRVVEAGVTASDWVIVNGLQRARPGVEVNPQEEQGAAVAANTAAK